MIFIFSTRVKTSLFILFLLFQSNQITNQTQGQSNSDVIIYALPYDFDEYSIYTANSYATSQWTSAVYNGLIKRDSTEGWVPDLAVELPTISSNGLVYTFKLQDELLFSNGHVLTSSDVAFSFKVALTSSINTNFFDSFDGYLKNNSIRIIDDLTIEFTFLQKYAFGLTLLNFPITDEAIFRDRYDRCLEGLLEDCYWNDESGLDAVGAGPFRVFDIDNVYEIVTVEANPYYYDADQVKTDKIIFQKIADKDTAISALAYGMIDLLDSQYVPGINELANIDGVTEEFVNDLSSQQIALNHLNPYYGTGEKIPGNNGQPNYDDALSVRKAMSHIVDRQFIVNEMMEGLATPATTIMPSGAIGWDTTIVPRNFSIATARNYMEMAGFD
ncbi:MAG: ABC transporter substrate-binding protein, partial [Candidatus Heimdallarchaeota archaeon]